MHRLGSFCLPANRPVGLGLLVVLARSSNLSLFAKGSTANGERVGRPCRRVLLSVYLGLSKNYPSKRAVNEHYFFDI